MTKRLKRISPLQCGIVLGALYAALTLVFLPIVFLIVVMSPEKEGGLGAAGIFLIFLPVLYAIFGFVVGVIGAAVYNLIAKWTGGLEFTFVDPPQLGGSLVATPPNLPQQY